MLQSIVGILSFTFAMKAEEVHPGLYQDALESLRHTEEVFYYLCPVCGNIEKFVPENAASVEFQELSLYNTDFQLRTIEVFCE